MSGLATVDTMSGLATVDTMPAATTAVDEGLGVSLVVGRRRCFVVPIRWRALGAHNVVAVFDDLRGASVAARRLAAVPSSVSAAMLVPVDEGAATSVVVGVHTWARDVADEAAVSLRRSGGRRVTRFPANGPRTLDA